MIEAKLSSEGMRNIPASKFPNDFRFIVGDRSYQCSSVVADAYRPFYPGFIQQIQPSTHILCRLLIYRINLNRFFHSVKG
jgi:hypothetical protein